MLVRIALLCFIAPVGVSAYPGFADQIPNGYSVPHPGPQGGVWAGVGHVNAAGGGDRNPFGLDFAAEGYQWSRALCEMDSDGDGRSNGIELGDPKCEWFAGGPDPAEPALSHPGIIDEPKDAPVENSCADFVEPPTIVPMDIAFSTANVLDETQTHYRCVQKTMAVPSQEVLHIVKTEILLDNPAVLHHMFVYLCPEGSSDGDRVGEGNYECSGQESRCRRIGGWGIGPHENCLPNNVGVEVDFSGIENVVVKVEAHYDNTSGQSQQDQSGIRVSLTPDLRPLKSGEALFGMAVVDANFEIPAQLSRHSLTNVCPSEATIGLTHPVYIYRWTPHMHLYGRSLYTEHYRCGQKIGELGRIDMYEFDNQQTYDLLTPIKVLPGDAFKTTCEYNTMDTNETIYGGEETTDEMCLNFLSFYPALQDGGSGFGPCFSFENGIKSVPDEVEIQLPSGVRLAFSGTMPSLESVLFDFDSDPANSWAPCCETNSCDEVFLAQEGGVCAEDTDCFVGVSCSEGLCATQEEEQPTKNPAEDDPDDGEDVEENVDEETGTGEDELPISAGGISFLGNRFLWLLALGIVRRKLGSDRLLVPLLVDF